MPTTQNWIIAFPAGDFTAQLAQACRARLRVLPGVDVAVLDDPTAIGAWVVQEMKGLLQDVNAEAAAVTAAQATAAAAAVLDTVTITPAT